MKKARRRHLYQFVAPISSLSPIKEETKTESKHNPQMYISSSIKQSLSEDKKDEKDDSGVFDEDVSPVKEKPVTSKLFKAELASKSRKSALENKPTCKRVLFLSDDSCTDDSMSDEEA